ncbi:MAG: hypothetical protein WCT53_04640, partial [Candidatus Gracilibacteria bacterium]
RVDVSDARGQRSDAQPEQPADGSDTAFGAARAMVLDFCRQHKVLTALGGTAIVIGAVAQVGTCYNERDLARIEGQERAGTDDTEPAMIFGTPDDCDRGDMTDSLRQAADCNNPHTPRPAPRY